MKIYLASKSPRRQSLLKQININFDCINLEIDETSIKGELPLDYVSRMAQEKASAGWSHVERKLNIPLLAADTCVVLDNVILGKPGNYKAAVEMLHRLSGKTHQVMTSLVVRNSTRTELSTSVTNVTFDQLSDQLIDYYVNTGDCFDKAGSYGIQGYAASFVVSISGSYSGVVGLPLYETSKALEQFFPLAPVVL